MGFFEGTVLFLAGLITFMVILPVATALLPDIQNTMGGTVVTMISAMFVIILVVAFMIYARQSQQPDTFMYGEGGSGGLGGELP